MGNFGPGLWIFALASQNQEATDWNAWLRVIGLAGPYVMQLWGIIPLLILPFLMVLLMLERMTTVKENL
jgi:hypothetical protein